MPYDNDSTWHGQFRVKIIVGILGNVRLSSYGVSRLFTLLCLAANFELFKR